jgi:predicted TPR repeat methyltransferase
MNAVTPHYPFLNLSPAETETMTKEAASPDSGSNPGSNGQDQVKQLLKEGVGGAAGQAKLHASLGQLLLRQQRFAQAVAELDQAIALEPKNAPWLINRAKALEFSGDIARATMDVSDAVMIDPQNPAYAAHLGQLLLRGRKIDEAIVCFSEAIRLAPEEISYYRNLASAMRAAGHLDSAIEIYERLIEAEPAEQQSYISLAEIGSQLKQPELTDRVATKALANGVSTAEIYRIAGNAALLLKDKDRALALYREGLEKFPDDGALKHMVTASSEEESEHVPDVYVSTLFDSNAADYERQIFEFRYRVPGLLRSELLRVRPKLNPDRPGAYKLSAVLDIGCGTGLTGIMAQDLTAYLKGVDLSPNMIAQAQSKYIYQELEIAEAVASMKADPRLYECVLAGGIMEYIGKADAALAQIYKRLLPSGLCLVSFLKSDVGDYALGADGRFRHSRSYIERIAAEAGFEIDRLAEEVIEIVSDVPVDGFFVTLVRPLK